MSHFDEFDPRKLRETDKVRMMLFTSSQKLIVTLQYSLTHAIILHEKRIGAE